MWRICSSENFCVAIGTIYIYIYIYVVAMPKSVLTLSIEMHPSGKDDQLEFSGSLERLGPLFMLVSVA